ncbi:MAG: 3-dehydroquinate synthase [Alphaproteobacteria bacterium]|nr:3-dehydroquinate synthase [Alphaproteobacteria bacterium]
MTNAAPDFADNARVAGGKIIPVDVAHAPYDIVIGQSILSESGTLIRLRMGARRCVIVTDSIIEPLYRARLEAVLAASGHDVRGAFVVPAGEASKDFAHLQYLLERMLEAGVDRKTLVIALGGGVVGDLAGLAASLLMRGIDLVQIPTTLLAQVDSSVGGKTGIDTAHGKNTVGTFYQPKLVIADVTLLDSLAAREMRAGYAEVVKYGLIADPAFFRWCQAHGGQLLAGDHESQIYAVGVSCAAKAKIVADDERESDKGSRALLNFGHTFGHALESATGYGNLLVHGEAVSIGMVMALRLSVEMGLCPAKDYEEARAHLASVGLPVKPPAFAYDIDRLMELMAQDKKATGGKLTLILARGIGQAFVSRDVDPAQVRALWKEFLV